MLIPRRAPLSGVTFPAGNPRRFLGALGRFARTESTDLRLGTLAPLEARAQRLHQIDDLALALGGCLGHRDLRAFLHLLLDRCFDTGTRLILERRRVETLRGLLIDELLCEFQLR